MVNGGWLGGRVSENPDGEALAVTRATVRAFAVIYCASLPSSSVWQREHVY